MHLYIFIHMYIWCTHMSFASIHTSLSLHMSRSHISLVETLASIARMKDWGL